MPSDVLAKPRFVSYLRVSTDKQGARGLGIEAQRMAVQAHLHHANHGAELLQEFVEVESGRKVDRPQLKAALERCELTGAVLIIAKLDRLSRDAHFLLGLYKAGVEFVACDLPEANRLTVTLMAAVAQHEVECISKRTREALAAAKARGTDRRGNPLKLGNPNGAAKLKGRGNREAVSAITAKAACRAAKLKGTLEAIRAEGHHSLTAIAAELGRRGIVTPRGGAWHPMAVKRLLGRLASHSGKTCTAENGNG